VRVCSTWEVATGEELDTIDWAASGAVNLCSFTPRGLGASGGSLLVTAHIDLKRNEGRILMWDVDRADSKVGGFAWAVEWRGWTREPEVWLA
jgi:hypothetical protein